MNILSSSPQHDDLGGKQGKKGNDINVFKLPGRILLKNDERGNSSRETWGKAFQIMCMGTLGTYRETEKCRYKMTAPSQILSKSEKNRNCFSSRPFILCHWGAGRVGPHPFYYSQFSNSSRFLLNDKVERDKYRVNIYSTNIHIVYFEGTWEKRVRTGQVE